MKMVSLLKNVVKYGAYIMVAIEIVEFAIGKIESINPAKKETEDVNESK